VGVLADQRAELREPALERVVETLLTGEPLAEALEAALQLPDDLELRVDRQPEGANFRRLGGRDVVVELLDEADERVGAFPVNFIELLTGKHSKMTSRGRRMDARGRVGR
jgi:DNA topoisomerase IB